MRGRGVDAKGAGTRIEDYGVNMSRGRKGDRRCLRSRKGRDIGWVIRHGLGSPVCSRIPVVTRRIEFPSGAAGAERLGCREER